ncbi:ChrR family anti-sigma-E factor [Pseudidiomarina sp.]|uniref:ChrR family anti-sigma-E factor n=1 Tax=Pseudidiomarina sp. TaxID=2081707 RepID=UPI00299F382B|nr:ChrR family anti-sigma-E factor [Pseudidiomarina sp.]MDX1705550.1 ChrR family anti-sigma-E factor [Pseudidiomarina sp.]
MIKFHPSEQQLVEYVAGDLTAAMLMTVGTHVDMCRHCQSHVQDIEEKLAQRLFGDVTDLPARWIANADVMIDEIINAAMPVHRSLSDSDNYLLLEGKRFELPATLARNYHRIGSWHKMLGKMWRAPVDLGSGEVLNFIYMGTGAQVPEHTHRGTEATLVINGVFVDESDEYRDGDFVLLDGQHKHTPQTQQEDCLTLATLDAPLQFTSGISRLLNPFSSLFFK